MYRIDFLNAQKQYILATIKVGMFKQNADSKQLIQTGDDCKKALQEFLLFVSESSEIKEEQVTVFLMLIIS